MINFVIDRSRKGKDKNNKKFKPYSKAYKSSLDFRLGGKTSKVNVTLSGEMLDSLEHLSDDSKSILIGHDKSEVEINNRAEGNIKGTYGNKKNSKSRDYLGLHKDDLDRILEDFPLRDKQARDLQLAKLKDISERSKEVIEGTALIQGELLDPATLISSPAEIAATRAAVRLTLKSADKKVESKGNKFDNNPTAINEKALRDAIIDREAVKAQEIRDEIAALKSKMAQIDKVGTLENQLKAATANRKKIEAEADKLKAESLARRKALQERLKALKKK